MGLLAGRWTGTQGRGPALIFVAIVAALTLAIAAAPL
jgi:hypothetical protein